MKSNSSLRIAFRDAAQPIMQPETKFGGSPVWIDGPQWPLSRRVGCPMRFIAQIALDPRLFPKAVARMAYIFMTDHPLGEETWDPDAGENAVILQPGSTSIAHAPLHTGPSLLALDPVRETVLSTTAEFATDLSLQTEPPYVPPQQRRAWSVDERTRYDNALCGHKIGGSPVFNQFDAFPFKEWRLLLQLDGGYGLPFHVNFGDGGSAYAISNGDVTQAKFLWQN
jgi:uncharacterized protein YwqG